MHNYYVVDLLETRQKEAVRRMREDGGVIGISGLGLMGPGIAAGLLAGNPSRRLILHDIDADKRHAVLDEVRRRVRALREAGLCLSPQSSDIQERIRVIDTIGDVRGSMHEIVAWIEAVTENDGRKRQFYQKADSLEPTIPILTNTSSRNIDVLAQMRERSTPGAGRMLAASHWSNPPELFPFVEVVPGDQTIPGLVESWTDILRQSAWQPIRLNKFSDGYILNAIQFALIDEACLLLDQQTEITASIIDSTVKALVDHWIQHGLPGATDARVSLPPEIDTHVADNLQQRMARTVQRLLSNGIAGDREISLIMKSGLAVRWRALGMLHAADLGKLDLFAEIHAHLMRIHGEDQPSDRLARMASAGKLGFHPSRGSNVGFFSHTAESVREDYQLLTQAYVAERRALHLVSK
jgi:3-hydroxyacyl-CoA dehydrogenase